MKRFRNRNPRKLKDLKVSYLDKFKAIHFGASKMEILELFPATR